jgi:hypothetical protein
MPEPSLKPQQITWGYMKEWALANKVTDDALLYSDSGDGDLISLDLKIAEPPIADMLIAEFDDPTDDYPSITWGSMKRWAVDVLVTESAVITEYHTDECAVDLSFAEASEGDPALFSIEFEFGEE